jgi:hypothetical protein
MRIIKAADAVPVEHPIFTLFGKPGICKSSLGYSAKNPLTLDYDAGCHRAANRRDTALIEKWSDVDDLQEVIPAYDSIVIDTVGRCLDLMSVDTIEKNPKYGRDGSLTLQGYGVLKSRFRTWITTLRTLGKDVILIAHEKEDKDGDSMIVRPDITGSSYGEVMKISDFIGYIYMSGKDRVVDFSPTDRWVGKNPAQWKLLKVPPVEKAQTFVAELIDKGRAALGSISEESAKVTQQVDDWRAALESYTTLEEVNRAIPESSKLPAIVAAQVKKLIMDRAKLLNFEWSGTAKAFVEKERVSA